MKSQLVVGGVQEFQANMNTFLEKITSDGGRVTDIKLAVSGNGGVIFGLILYTESPMAPQQQENLPPRLDARNV